MNTQLTQEDAAGAEINIAKEEHGVTVTAMLRNGSIKAGDIPMTRRGDGYCFGVFVCSAADLPVPKWAWFAKRFGWKPRTLNCRRQGIGRRMWDAAINWVRAEGGGVSLRGIVLQRG